ncbi:MAG: hypothetical protein JW797_15845 [Bradymonadales bacterium]|nr:hypothetical protein [Bradymonadales bacterium]
MNRSKIKMVASSLLVLAAAAYLSVDRGQGRAQAQPGQEHHIGPSMAVVQEIFNHNCLRCHRAASPAASLDLSPEGAYQQLVGRPSIQAPGLMRVQPGAPGDSYLLLKISEGQQHLERGGRGRRMPLGAPPLDPTQIRLVEEWIMQGAAR